MIRVFPRRTKWTPNDDLTFVGDVPLFRPLKEMPVSVSVTFTQDIPEAERLQKAWGLYYSDVKIGGPAMGDAGGEFVPGRFIKQGVVITSRGCPRSCPWCHVPGREGKIREFPVTKGHIIQDNNLLACSEDHIRRVFEMLKTQRKATIFSGGLDTRLLLGWHVKLLHQVKVREMWFACDTTQGLNSLARTSEFIKEFPRYKKRCYVLMGYGNESIEQATNRVESVLEMGFLPFAQLYKGQSQRDYDKDWKALARKWSRPAAYNSKDAI